MAIDQQDFCPDSTVVLGMGAMGGKIEELLRQILGNTNVFGLDVEPGKGVICFNSSESHVEFLKDSHTDMLVLAVSADRQVDEAVPVAAEWLKEAWKEGDTEKKKVVVNINSVQSNVRDALVQTVGSEVEPDGPVVLVSIHQYHRPDGFDELDGKKWILTDVTALGVDEESKAQIETQMKDQIHRFVAELPEELGQEGAEIDLYDLTEGVEIDGQQLNGAEFHDLISAYYQALFHVVKLAPGVQETLFYREYFSQVKASDSLSRSIIENNPFVERFGLEGKFRQMTAGHYDMLPILSAVSQLLKEADEIIPESLHALKTPNVEILEDLVKRHEVPIKAYNSDL